MSMYSGATTEGWGRRCGPNLRWRPLEILARVLGFMTFWPLGLAVIGFKFWQRKTGYEGDMVTMARESYDSVRSGDFARGPWARSFSWGCAPREGNGARRARDFGGFARMRPTGNVAFDEWRDAELTRLEEERRKLDAAQQEFADYMENLRRAKDREEFDRFMSQRGRGTPPADTGHNPSA